MIIVEMKGQLQTDSYTLPIQVECDSALSVDGLLIKAEGLYTFASFGTPSPSAAETGT